VLIQAITPTAGKSHVPRPGVPGAFRPSDYQDGIGIGTDDEGDGRLANLGIADRDWDPTMKPKGQELLKGTQ
jgi:hypothetical protein